MHEGNAVRRECLHPPTQHPTVTTGRDRRRCCRCRPLVAQSGGRADAGQQLGSYRSGRLHVSVLGLKKESRGRGLLVFRVRGHLVLWWGAPPPADPQGQAKATPPTPSFLIKGGSREEAREKGVRKQQMGLSKVKHEKTDKWGKWWWLRSESELGCKILEWREVRSWRDKEKKKEKKEEAESRREDVSNERYVVPFSAVN